MSSDSKKILILIDAHAIIHRAFHAIPPLTTKRGELVNAVYGFASTFLHVISTLEPTHIAVCFDEKGPTFRHEQFKDYKAHRVATPNNLIAQFPLTRELIKAFGIPSFGITGYEADDLIGTLSRQAQKEDVETLIVTGDKDAYQLINHKVRVYNVGRGNKNAEIVDEDAFKDKYGFDPKHLVDLKALQGDPSDNIPGVAGIGEKTAIDLVKQFGSIEKLYDHLNCNTNAKITSKVTRSDSFEMKEAQVKVSSKIRDKLCADQESAFLSKKLATIDTNAPIKLDLDACTIKHYDEEGARKLFEELGFQSLTKRLPKSVSREQQTLF